MATRKTSAERTYARHMKQLDTGTADTRLVIGMRRALTNAYRRDRGWSHNEGMMDDDQLADITARIYQEAPVVNNEAQAFGLAYLRKPRNFRKLSAKAQSILDAGMCQIRLVGFRMGEDNVYRPRYMVESMKRDQAFYYVVTPWQAGGDGLEEVIW